jgi:asparagine synthase (glutamine-hydrolysing)
VCGLAGTTSHDARTARRFTRRMLGELSHRGPDGSGIASVASSALGMSHLRVRTDAGDAVPFKTRQGVVAFNGEVYGQLGTGISLGRPPVGGGGEVELIVDPLQDAPPDGMYAVALVENDGRIKLWRDAFGIKPLYMLRHASGIAFASELKALARSFGLTRINKEAAADYLVFGRSMGADDYYCGIQQVAPNEVIELSGGKAVRKALGAALHCRRNYDGPVDGKTLIKALEKSVEACLVSQRPVGLAVSGGIDSTLIAGLVARLHRLDFSTVSVLVDGERDGIRDLMSLGLPPDICENWRHDTVAVSASNYLPLLAAAIAAWGLPTRMTSLPLYFALGQKAKAMDIVVLLTGEGSDELFMGYPGYHALLSSMSQTGGEPLRLVADYAAGNEQTRYWLGRALGPTRYSEAIERFMTRFAGIRDASNLELLRQVELACSLEPLLARADISLMAHGVEGRMPFLHGAVPGIAACATADQLIGHSASKKLIVDAAKALFGPAYQPRAKQAFRAPVARWLAGPLAERVSGFLSDSAEILESTGFEPDGVREIAAALLSGKPGAAAAAYPLLSQVFAAEASLSFSKTVSGDKYELSEASVPGAGMEGL